MPFEIIGETRKPERPRCAHGVLKCIAVEQRPDCEQAAKRISRYGPYGLVYGKIMFNYRDYLTNEHAKRFLGIPLKRGIFPENALAFPRGKRIVPVQAGDANEGEFSWGKIAAMLPNIPPITFDNRQIDDIRLSARAELCGAPNGNLKVSYA